MITKVTLTKETHLVHSVGRWNAAVTFTMKGHCEKCELDAAAS